MSNIKADLQTIKKVVNELVDFVKPTYGPNGKKVLIYNKKEKTFLVLDDGVRSARAFIPSSDVDEALLGLIKETSDKTYLRVKDGTTLSLITLQGILNNVDTTDVNLNLDEVKMRLKEATIKYESENELTAVAKMAYKDEEIAKHQDRDGEEDL